MNTITSWLKDLPKLTLKSLKRLIKAMSPSLIAIGIGLLMGFIVMLFFNPMTSVPAFSNYF